MFNQIFIQCMQGWGRLVIEYSFGVWMGQVDCLPNTHLVYAGIWQMIDQIFIWCMNGLGRLKVHI
jgi:hypothetical protein